MVVRAKSCLVRPAPRCPLSRASNGRVRSAEVARTAGNEQCRKYRPTRSTETEFLHYLTTVAKNGSQKKSVPNSFSSSPILAGACFSESFWSMSSSRVAMIDSVRVGRGFKFPSFVR